METTVKNRPTGKSPAETHQFDVFSETLQQTANKGYYQEAQSELAPKPYAERNRNLYIFSNGFKSVYHIISFLLGIGSALLIAKAFHTGETSLLGILMIVLVGILLIGLLVGLELLKSQSAANLYKAIAKGEKLTTGAQIGLSIAFVFSILVSAVGGAFLSVEMNDKSQVIQKELLTESDSLKNLYHSQLEAFETSIISAQTTLQKHQTGWRANVARQDLNKAVEGKNNLLAHLDKQLTHQTANATNKTLHNAKEGKNIAFIVALVVLVLELIAMLCYRFKYMYLRNTEREGVNMHILPTKDNGQVHTPNEPLKELAELLKTLVQQPTPVVANVAFPSPYTSHTTSYSPIGFQVPKATPNDSRITHDVKRNTLEDGNRECLNCGGVFTYKTWNHTYCQESCRIEHWEKRTGKTFKKGKK